MKRFVFALALLTLLAPPARAAGVNLAWNDCGTFGACNQSFACDTNGPGVFTLVGSFVPPPGLSALIGEEIVLDLISQSATLPDWWQLKNVGSCRMTALSASADFTGGPVACADYWAGQAQGGVAAYRVGTAIGPSYPPNMVRVVMAFAIPAITDGSLDEYSEYYSFRLNIAKAKTVGTGACAGCDVPLGFYFTRLKLVQPVGVGDYYIDQPVSSAFAAWQNGWFYSYDVGYSCPPVPARNKTWGALKSLYR